MGIPFYQVRRELAQEMNLWGGKVDGQSLGPATFSSVDTQGSLYVVYDITRPEPDDDWNSSYICINPGGTGNSNLATIWRRVADDAGFVNSTGAITITAPLPSAAYAQTTMTYELFKTFTPEQWLKAVNFAVRSSYPQRHRLLSFEMPEDSSTIFYDWGHFANLLTLSNPSVVPTMATPNDPGGKTNYFTTGNYTVAYNFYNAAGETLVSPTNTVSLSPTTILEFDVITAPEGSIGVNYWCTQEAGGSVLVQLSVGAGVLPAAQVDNVTPKAGIVDTTTFIAPKIRFWGPPSQLSRSVPIFNTTQIETNGLSMKGLKRRLNPGQFPESFIDLSPQWWREEGGTIVKLNYPPNSQFSLRFECMGPIRTITGESDTTEEPLELLIAGSMLYLWNLQAMTGSSQNVTIWQAESKIADMRFTKARNLYQMPGPRKTMRRPFIKVIRGWGYD